METGGRGKVGMFVVRVIWPIKPRGGARSTSASPFAERRSSEREREKEGGKSERERRPRAISSEQRGKRSRERRGEKRDDVIGHASWYFERVCNSAYREHASRRGEARNATVRDFAATTDTVRDTSSYATHTLCPGCWGPVAPRGSRIAEDLRYTERERERKREREKERIPTSTHVVAHPFTRNYQIRVSREVTNPRDGSRARSMFRPIVWNSSSPTRP